jgi:hypothetical protein
MVAISIPNATHGPPPSLMYSSISYDHDGNFLIKGGGMPLHEETRDLPFPAILSSNGSWTLSVNSGSWLRADSRTPEPRYVPTYSLHAQAPEHDLVFHLNGILSNGSIEQAYSKMMVFNKRTNNVRIVNTEIVSRSAARLGAVFQYLPLLGRKGALVLFGGAARHNNNTSSDHWGTMVMLLFPRISRFA